MGFNTTSKPPPLFTAEATLARTNTKTVTASVMIVKMIPDFAPAKTITEKTISFCDYPRIKNIGAEQRLLFAEIAVLSSLAFGKPARGMGREIIFNLFLPFSKDRKIKQAAAGSHAKNITDKTKGR